MKTPSDGEWRALVVPPAVEQPIDLGAPDPDRIGSVRCLGEVIEDGRAYLAYEYEVSPGKLGQSPKGPIPRWKVLTDRMTALPIKYSRRMPISGGVLEEVETRAYEPGLKVEPPVRIKAAPAMPVSRIGSDGNGVNVRMAQPSAAKGHTQQGSP